MAPLVGTIKLMVFFTNTHGMKPLELMAPLVGAIKLVAFFTNTHGTAKTVRTHDIAININIIDVIYYQHP